MTLWYMVILHERLREKSNLCDFTQNVIDDAINVGRLMTVMADVYKALYKI